MRFGDAIDLFVADWRNCGHLNSDGTETAYRQVLNAHAEDVGNRDPRTTNHEDCKRTLTRWPHPNTQRSRRAALVSFYDWAMEEGHRKDNPARQTRRPRKRPSVIYRMTRAEVIAFLAAARDDRHRRIAYLGICAGARNQELRGFRGEHFTRRDGFIWFSRDIAKGQKEAWIPIIADLTPIVEEIRTNVADDEYVIPSRYTLDPGRNQRWGERPDTACSSQSLQRAVHQIARDAQIRTHIHPHLMRHAFADHIAKGLGLYAAQGLMRHSDVSTTQGYVGAVTPDELAQTVRHFRLLEHADSSAAGIPPPDPPKHPVRRGGDSNPRS